MENKNFRKNTEKKEDLINLASLINIFMKNWKWFALSVFLFLGMGVLYLLIKNPIYSVDAAVLLREDEKKSSSAMSSMMAGFSDLGSMMGSKNVDNEVVIFNTRRIMKKSLIDLNMYISYQIRDGLRVINPYPFNPFNITIDPALVDTMQYTLTFTMKPTGKDQYKISGEYDDDEFETTVNGFPATIKTPSVDVYIEKNPNAYRKENGKPYSVDVTIFNPNALAILMQKKIGAGATSKKTTIIRLSTETDNIKWAQDLLNKIIENFNIDAIEDKNMTAILTANFINERIKRTEQELNGVEKVIEEFKIKNKLVDFSSQIKFYLSQSGEYEKSHIEAQIQQNMIGYIEDYVKDDKNKNNLIPSIGIEDKGLVAIIAKYNELLTERNRIETTSTISNPALNEMNSQLISMRQNIISNIGNVRNSLKIMVDDLKKQDLLASSRMSEFPSQEREFYEIWRQQEVRYKIYAFLLQKREENDLNLASITPKAKVIDEPMPGIKPIAPKKKVVLFIVLCLGFAAPAVFFYLKKMLKTEIESKEELESLSKVEIIGEICKDSAPNKISVRPNETTPSVELFRLLRTNLSFIFKDASEKVILLTSTMAGEGKTYVSINLASSLSLIDKKILVVGLDIRNPRLGDYLDTPSGKGVTNFLIDKSLKVNDIIQHSGVHKNMDIIQAGPIPPNPNELLLSPRLDELFADAKELYDYIIVDSAPVGLVSDTFLLNRIADVCLYVVRIGVARKDSIKFLNSIKDKDKLKNLYVVANGIDLKSKNGGYGYGYGQK